ncbi:MAG TPA: ArsI/CadI family heavy metal resistance metalloenzyme [Pirellulales bacterium]|nr:ArsI/CadI family heavy metal resistance metalloenzyme [Pirellulales bacterium]
MSTAIELETAQATKFHLSLNVNELDRSIRFLTALLGVEPAKQRSDYAKFELSDPPLVLSLEPHGFAAGGALNHLGFRMPDAAALVAAQARLEAAGIATQREEGVECCYARQTKFWVHDPDGSLWEIYVFEGDIEHRGAGQALEVIQQSTGGPTIEPPAARTTLQHRLGQPFPEQLALADGTPCPAQAADEVLLQGTFNLRLDAGQRRRILAEVRRVLRPGGRVLAHVLTAAEHLPEDAALRLPGPAAAVEHVPVDRELLAELEAAGFTGIHYAKFGASPCFHFAGVELRETKLLANQPGRLGGSVEHTVVYKGPFRELRDDVGRLYRRGERVAVDAETRELLKAGPAAEQFLFLGRS